MNAYQDLVAIQRPQSDVIKVIQKDWFGVFQTEYIFKKNSQYVKDYVHNILWAEINAVTYESFDNNIPQGYIPIHHTIILKSNRDENDEANFINQLYTLDVLSFRGNLDLRGIIMFKDRTWLERRAHETKYWVLKKEPKEPKWDCEYLEY